jgi:hypothetical protein
VATRARAYLCSLAAHAVPITYQALARALALTPPNTIHQVTGALEQLIHEDAAASCPFIASLVISKTRGGMPAPGFFDCAQRLGRINADLSEAEQSAFYTAEFKAAAEYWCRDGTGAA